MVSAGGHPGQSSAQSLLSLSHLGLYLPLSVFLPSLSFPLNPSFLSRLKKTEATVENLRIFMHFHVVYLRSIKQIKEQCNSFFCLRWEFPAYFLRNMLRRKIHVST